MIAIARKTAAKLECLARCCRCEHSNLTFSRECLFISPDHAAHEFDSNQAPKANFDRLLTDEVEQFCVNAFAHAALLACHLPSQRFDRHVAIDLSQLGGLEVPLDIAVPTANKHNLTGVVSMHEGPRRAFVPSFGLLGHIGK
ncbi:hypothetical protein EN804_31545 [Mesorhizobium sp. M8A.F.Ca.ET.161.01.1.1]|uniref:hypothetical protein n=1 Tax=unclassified Mesorhizobium TaxID=325217 RepID=UPI0010931313|nr:MULTISPECIES: hypothetical protein [unclassified Mesorhizobium]TGP85926.1 hypothetical protein EN861_32435 [Mesorhizobium sp. M8A.F.Ca.ET.218.01.1.1]TGT14836.1 hypothetical protein EN856_31975 [Mesorhizobium sp. M8A.F.Ca.ET.213.01.1.1]TGT82212.1 hypothetical protein EN804_31545 [Mesorhizobium sp. M8A.F.Ca.ET.161.01.1.1]TJX79775.1 MAG: hypothetical protein E5W21_01585 [Mesorhizobium sp.]